MQAESNPSKSSSDHGEAAPHSSHFPKDLKETLKDTAERISTAAETWQLKYHLADMEFQDLRQEIGESFNQLKDRMREFAEQMESHGEEGQLKLQLGLMDAKDQWDLTVEHAKKILESSKSTSDNIGEAKELLKDLKLQAAIASMETRDFIGEKTEDIKNSVAKLAQQSWDSLRKMNESVQHFVKQLQS